MDRKRVGHDLRADEREEVVAVGSAFCREAGPRKDERTPLPCSASGCHQKTMLNSFLRRSPSHNSRTH